MILWSAGAVAADSPAAPPRALPAVPAQVADSTF